MATLDQATADRKLHRIFRDRLHLEVPSSNTDILESGLLDSVAFVDLIVRIEEDFGINVEVEEIELDDFRSIASIAAYLVSRENGG